MTLEEIFIQYGKGRAYSISARRETFTYFVNEQTFTLDNLDEWGGWEVSSQTSWIGTVVEFNDFIENVIGCLPDNAEYVIERVLQFAEKVIG